MTPLFYSDFEDGFNPVPSQPSQLPKTKEPQNSILVSNETYKGSQGFYRVLFCISPRIRFNGRFTRTVYVQWGTNNMFLCNLLRCGMHIYWLVVSNILLFSISYIGLSFSLALIFFKMVKTTNPNIYIYIEEKKKPSSP